MLSAKDVEAIKNASFTSEWKDKVSSTRTLTYQETWPGIMKYIFEQNGGHNRLITSSHIRNSQGAPKKVDYIMKDEWAKQMCIYCEPFQRLYYRISKLLHQDCCQFLTWHLMVTPPKCPSQVPHYDNKLEFKEKCACYKTVIIPLTKDPVEAGGSYFSKSRKLINEFGSCLIFDGNILHHGTANLSESHTRIFLFVVVSSQMIDIANDDT